jgi:hypothetical protein
MPTKKKATSRRELIEPTKGDKRYVRRNAKGEFNKVVDVGKSLASDKRTTAKRKVPKGQGDRGRYEAINRPVPSIPAVLDNAAIAELLIREAETADWPSRASTPARRPRGFHVVGGSPPVRRES